MRVVLITAMFPPIRTGTSFYSKNLATALVNKGIQVEIITTTNKDLSDKNQDYRLRIHRIPALYIPLKNYFKHLRFCSVIPSNYRRIKKILKDFRPDLILLVNHYLDIAFPTVIIANKLKIPVYVSVGTQLQSLNNFRNRVLRFLDRLLIGHFVFPKVKRIIAWDKEIVRYINETHKKKHSDKAEIIQFGVNGDIDYYRSFNNTYKNTNQILGVGAIIEHRNYTYQIRVFKELVKIYPNLIFKIIGHIYINKPQKLARELNISDRIVFTGELSHDEVLREYQNSILHWMMLNAEYVGLGTSTIEAMLMGIPVVSNVPDNLFGMNELLDMHNYIFSTGSIEEDKDKISKILGNPALRKNIGTKGKLFVQKYMNWDIIAKRFIDLSLSDTDHTE